MNKQRTKNKTGIGWCDYTWNPIAGCFHDCKWAMPSGDIAECYAKAVAERLATKAYPDGFEHYYYHPNRLDEPGTVAEPSKIFIDSMSDMFGSWVSKHDIVNVLAKVKEHSHHTFIVLTKNPGRLQKFTRHFPSNLWILVSSPPDYMHGSKLSLLAKYKYVYKSIKELKQLKQFVSVVGMSIEPLSFDIGKLLATEHKNLCLDWIIVGAASNGSKVYQPQRSHIENLVNVATENVVPLFMKKQLEWQPRLQEFPIKWQSTLQ